MPVDFSATALAAGQNAFGEPVQFMPAAGDVIVTSDPFWEGFETIGAVANCGRGVFDEGNHDVSFDSNDVPHQSVSPTIGIRLEEFTREPEKNDRLEIVKSGLIYRVIETMPDSHGGMRLRLQLEGAS